MGVEGRGLGAVGARTLGTQIPVELGNHHPIVHNGSLPAAWWLCKNRDVRWKYRSRCGLQG